MSDEPITLLARVASHLWSMHRWQHSLFTFCVLLFAGGSVSQMAAYFNGPPANGQSTVQSTDGNSTAAPRSNAPNSNAPARPFIDQSLIQKMAPWATRIGASFVGGFIIGFALRIFLRITAALLVIGLAAIMLLSHFNLMNFDLDSIRTKYESSIHSMDNEATHLTDRAKSYLPSSTTGLFGTFAGFRRRRSGVA